MLQVICRCDKRSAYGKQLWFSSHKQIVQKGVLMYNIMYNILAETKGFRRFLRWEPIWHTATIVLKDKKSPKHWLFQGFLSRKRDLNSWPLHYEWNALPTELLRHTSKVLILFAMQISEKNFEFRKFKIKLNHFSSILTRQTKPPFDIIRIFA